MTHKFEIKETIEVTFPHYRRYEFFFYKVLSPIIVCTIYNPVLISNLIIALFHSYSIFVLVSNDKNIKRISSIYSINDKKYNKLY